MRFTGSCYRAHNPKWAFSALSGEGAKIYGARFNPKGVAALYLGLTIEGAIIESLQGFASKIEPLTLCLYEIDCEDIVDLSTPASRKGACVTFDDIACAWALDLSNGMRPASWRVAETLVRQGAAGMLVPSFARSARPDLRNLVLWKWGPGLPWRVAVHDPSGRLPGNVLSGKAGG